MSATTSKQILQLYRDLLRYGKQLKFTDKTYYTDRIRAEFKRNKNLQSEADIEFNIKVNIHSFIKFVCIIIYSFVLF